MTRRSCLLLLVVFTPLLILSLASAEGVWRVKGHSFSNVHAWQKGSQVRVSGRVSGGPARAPFQAVILVQDDAGGTHRVTIRKTSFSGQGETFEGGFKAPKRSRWWQVIGIEVVGADPDEVRSLKGGQAGRATGSVQAPPPPAAALDYGAQKFFPLESRNGERLSGVVFATARPVCVTVRERGSGRLILIKNVAPGDTARTPLPPGDYAAHIVGDGFALQKSFSVSSPEDTVDLD